MLTRELLRFRTRKGVIRPLFVDPRDDTLHELAGALIKIAERGLGHARGAVESALDERAKEHSVPVVGKGLAKLLADRFDVEDVDDTIAAERFEAFLTAADVLRSRDGVTTSAEFEKALAKRVGDLAALRSGLYRDLPENRRITKMGTFTPARLLERYNLALAQGLILYAERVTVRFKDPGPALQRKVLRWLRFCRLVAAIERVQGDHLLSIEGPGAVFNMQKRYGLQLANFVSIVPALPEFELSADVRMPRKAACELTLSNKDGLSSTHAPATGHIPEEISRAFDSYRGHEDWAFDPEPPARNVGVASLSVPDFSLTHKDDAQPIFVELFHRWHKSPLLRRFDDLAARPDPRLVLGVDRELLKDPELEQQIEAHASTFSFNKYPSFKKIRPLLESIRAAAEAEAAPANGRDSQDGVRM